MRLHPASFSLAIVVAIPLAAILPWLPAAEDNAPGVVATMKGHTEAVYSVAFTPDGKYVASGSGDHTLKVWDSATGKEIKSFGGPTGHQNLVMSVSISPDGSLIASGGTDNTAKIWDFPSSTSLHSLPKSEGASILAVSSDGSKLAGGDKDGHVKIWNSADGKELFQLNGHRGPVTGLAFTGNGQFLISCGKDKTLRFWNPANGQSLGVVGAHTTEVRGLAVSPNNNAVYSAGADGSLKFWTLPPVASKTLAAAPPHPTPPPPGGRGPLSPSPLVGEGWGGGELGGWRETRQRSVRRRRPASRPGPLPPPAMRATNGWAALQTSQAHLLESGPLPKRERRLGSTLEPLQNTPLLEMPSWTFYRKLHVYFA